MVDHCKDTEYFLNERKHLKCEIKHRILPYLLIFFKYLSNLV